MVERVLLLATALFLSLPLVHYVAYERVDRSPIDYNSPAWKAREALIARASVFVRVPDISTVDLSKTPYDPAPNHTQSGVDSA